MEHLFEDLLGTSIIALASIVAFYNLVFAFSGHPESLRPYRLVKGIIAFAVATIYVMAAADLVDPAAPPNLGRAALFMVLFLMVTDIYMNNTILDLLRRREDSKDGFSSGNH